MFGYSELGREQVGAPDACLADFADRKAEPPRVAWDWDCDRDPDVALNPAMEDFARQGSVLLTSLFLRASVSPHVDWWSPRPSLFSCSFPGQAGLRSELKQGSPESAARFADLAEPGLHSAAPAVVARDMRKNLRRLQPKPTATEELPARRAIARREAEFARLWTRRLVRELWLHHQPAAFWLRHQLLSFAHPRVWFFLRTIPLTPRQTEKLPQPGLPRPGDPRRRRAILRASQRRMDIDRRASATSLCRARLRRQH